MREWLSGRASPCQGERREFESRLPLQKRLFKKSIDFLNSLIFFRGIEKSFGINKLSQNFSFGMPKGAYVYAKRRGLLIVRKEIIL